ncbi:MAG: hypothetical protein IPJ88_05445 [Myxococcales bacterium]|nr:MAG: hypothetical protein IPJ88_05445 [Myxococcales bacterium]
MINSPQKLFLGASQSLLFTLLVGAIASCAGNSRPHDLVPTDLSNFVCDQEDRPFGYEWCPDPATGEDACVNVLETWAHCNGCNQPCAEGQLCDQGSCVADCGDGIRVPCDGACINPYDSTAHCGGCPGVPVDLAAGEICLDGVPSCPPGTDKYQGVCVAIGNNDHCLEAGDRCGQDEECTSSGCQSIYEAEICNDSIDNDGNGLKDCADVDACCNQTVCYNDPACDPPITAEICTDGLDNDQNGKIDCYDTTVCCSNAACTGHSACGGGGNPPPPPPPPGPTCELNPGNCKLGTITAMCYKLPVGTSQQNSLQNNGTSVQDTVDCFQITNISSSTVTVTVSNIPSGHDYDLFVYKESSANSYCSSSSIGSDTGSGSSRSVTITGANTGTIAVRLVRQNSGTEAECAGLYTISAN